MYNIKFDNGKCGLEVECTSRDARDAMLFTTILCRFFAGEDGPLDAFGRKVFLGFVRDELLKLISADKDKLAAEAARLQAEKERAKEDIRAKLQKVLNALNGKGDGE